MSFEAELSATLYSEHEPRRVLITIADLSAQRQAEAQRERLKERLRQTEKLNALGQLAGGIAHDFNNILTVISANAHIAALYGGEVKEVAEEIVSCSDRGTRLVRQLLAASRQQKLSPEAIDLSRLIHEMRAMFRSALPETISLHLPEEREPQGVYADPTQIERALLNLVINARDAMPSGGALTIALSQTSLSASESSQWPGVHAGRYVRVAVSDTGLGMDEATRARIFEPFFTTKPTGQGTGLGLATVHGVIQQSGGFTTVESTLNEGSTFTLHLPYRKLSPSAAPPVPRVQHRVVVLLVDDDQPVLRATTRALRVHKVNVISAGSGEEAIRLYEEHRDTIDVLVTDVVMPAMSGPELALSLIHI